VSAILNKISDLLKARYWRAVIIGVTTPPSDSWKIYLMTLANPAAIAISLSIIVFEPDPHHWRVYLSWGLLAIFVLMIPLTVIMVHSHYNREKIDLAGIESKYNQIPNLDREFKLILAAVLVGPPIVLNIIKYFEV